MKARWSSPISLVLDQLKKIKGSFFVCKDSPRVLKIEPKKRVTVEPQGQSVHIPSLFFQQFTNSSVLLPHAMLAMWARRSEWAEGNSLGACSHCLSGVKWAHLPILILIGRLSLLAASTRCLRTSITASLCLVFSKASHRALAAVSLK